MNKKQKFRSVFGSLLLGAILLAPSTVFAQDKKTEEEAKKWMEAVAKKVQEDAKRTSGGKLAREALLNATKPQETTDVVPTITDTSIDLDAFMSRYRLDQGTMKQALGQPANFYVFVSFSMDIKAIKDIGRDVGRAGGTMVLRGLVNNSLPETTAKLAELQGVVLGAESDGTEQGQVSVNMVVDPTLFNKFNVQQVPSFVVTEALNNPCLDFECIEEVPPFDRLSGLVTVEYALKTIAEKGHEAKNHAGRLLKKVEATQW